MYNSKQELRITNHYEFYELFEKLYLRSALCSKYPHTCNIIIHQYICMQSSLPSTRGTCSTGKSSIKNTLKKIPNKPGIYLFYNKQKDLIYIGKATNLKSRVKSYFQGQKSPRPIEELIEEVDNIKWIVTDNVLEAIILEANYIKKFEPKYNVIGKDDKSWNYLVITNDEFPQVKFIRQHELENPRTKNLFKNKIFGPYPGVSTKNLFKALRKIFWISTCKPDQPRACFYRQIDECLGVCTGEIKADEYKKKVIEPLIKFLKGNKKSLVKSIEKQMKQASQEQDYEEAARLRDQLRNLKRVQDITLINKSFFEYSRLVKENFRIEGYDISNLGATGKVGSMVVFNQDGPVKSNYRKFKIRTVKGQSDVDCLKEIIERRLKHDDWPLPKVFLIDGGKPQVNAVRSILKNNKINLPVIGIAKGPNRKKNEFVLSARNKNFLDWFEKNKNLLIQTRDEAHRFAIQYQRQTRKIK